MPHPQNLPQLNAYVSAADILYFGGSAGGGKALASSEPVITPWGTKCIGDLRPGDTICNPDGTHQKVLYVYHQGKQQLYEVGFQDGVSVKTTADHLWLYSHGTGWRVASTEILLDKLGSEYSLQIPLTLPVNFAAATRSSLEPTVHSDAKFIPKQYLLAPVEVRWKLLQGLMESTGEECVFSSSSEEFAQDVRTLVWSLGGRASLSVKNVYSVHIQIPTRSDSEKEIATLKRRIDYIEPIGEDEATCISVDHPNGLFLTRGFVVTHNSDLLLGLALTAHRKSIIFRRKYTQIRELEDRSRELLHGTGATYNQTLMRWRNIPGSRTLEFGAMQLEKDKENYKGRPHDLKAFDEIPDFTESQFRFCCAWNRSTDPEQRCRVVCAGNPPTEAEGEWVIRFWGPWLDEDYPKPASPGELRYFANLDGEDVEVEGKSPFTHKGEKIVPLSRTFIPSFLSNNPYLANTGYASVLQGLPEPLRSQLLLGLFRRFKQDAPNQLIPTEWVRIAQARWRSREEPDIPISSVGVDPSRGGADSTVIARRKGNYFLPLLAYPGEQVPNGPACASLVIESLGQDTDAQINVDVIGWGASAYDCLEAEGFDVYPINVSERSLNRDRSGLLEFTNLRTELYWKFKEALDPESGEEIALPPDRELLEDLTSPKWGMTTRGVALERKHDIRKRIGRSTGKGDAVVLAFHHTEGVFFA